MKEFIVICRADRRWDSPEVPGRYELATRTVFADEATAARYAVGISPEREPVVVSGRFSQLRRDQAERLGLRLPEEPR